MLEVFGEELFTVFPDMKERNSSLSEINLEDELQKAEKKGEKIGKIKMLIDLFSQGIVNLNIVMSVIRQEFDIQTDDEVEKKVQEIFPDFQLPAKIIINS